MSTRLIHNEKRMNKLQYTYTVEGRSALLLHATTQMNLRNILLSETQRALKHVPYDYMYVKGMGAGLIEEEALR